MMVLLLLVTSMMTWMGGESMLPSPLYSPGRPCGPCECFDPGPMVDCSNRSLTNVPHTGLPTNTSTLLLYYNSISRLQPFAFFAFDSLQHLNLSHNVISSIAADAFQGLDKLLTLNIAHNRLDCLHQLFMGLNNLQQLDLSFNHIPLTDEAYPPDAFAPFQSALLELSLAGNCKADSENHSLRYPDQALSQLTSLHTLHMDGLPHAAFGPKFHNMTSLANLSLSGVGGGHCSMNTLSNQTFLHVPSSLRRLDISGCNITHINNEAFRPLRQVEVLDLSFNLDLGFDTLGDAFYSLQWSALRVLHINSIIRPYTMCVMVTPWNTRFFKNTSLEVIHAWNNCLEAFCEKALSNMPDTLRFVTVDKNKLSFGNYLKDLANLKNVVVIHNDGHREAFDPPTEYPRDHLKQCLAPSRNSPMSHEYSQLSWRSDDSTQSLWMPEEADVSHEATTSRHTRKLIFTLPPKLNMYVSRWNKLYYKILDVDFNPNNSLKILNLSNNLITTWIGPITGLNKLRVLDLANNFAHAVSVTFFDTLRSLKTLRAGNNDLRSFIESDIQGRWFEPLDQLEELYLEKNYINKIPKMFFKGLVNIRRLDLSHNVISTFDVNITHMKNISMLDLSYNNIHFLPQFIMDHLDQVADSQNDVTIKMTFNPIACTCAHIDFLTWMLDSKVRFPHGDNYYCLTSDGNTPNKANIFEVIRHLRDTCTDKSGILTGTISCFICLMMVLVAAIMYRYRWKLRYLYYASRLFYNRVDSSDNDDFIYDAFVSYSSEDNDFVHGQLLEELETRAGLRLNIHNRDFTPGRLIPSNIVDAIQKSRHTLVVLTRELLESDWCHYEMQMATMEASYTGRDVLLFLLYEDVPSHDLPRDVFYNLQASTYISFPTMADPPLVRDFWARLVQAIRQ